MSLYRRLRGALGNAVVWGLSWLGASASILTTIHLTGVLPFVDPWRTILLISLNSAVTGFLTGTVFSGLLAFVYRDRSLLDIRVGRFAVVGAVIAAVFSGLVNSVAGASVGIGGLLTGGIVPAALGGVTAGVTLAVAKHAARKAVGGATSQLQAEQDDVAALLSE